MQIQGIFSIDGAYQRVTNNQAVQSGKKYNAVISFDGKKEILYINGDKIAENNITR